MRTDTDIFFLNELTLYIACKEQIRNVNNVWSNIDLRRIHVLYHVISL